MSSLEMSIADYQRIVMGNPLDDRFMRSLAVIGQSCHRMKWYTTCMVALAAMSIGDQVRPFYKRLLANFIPEKARFSETGKLREALLKTTGIIGTAKAGTALRALASGTPADLVDYTHHRENYDPEEAKKRGRALFDGVHSHVTDYDETEAINVSPDYHHGVIDLVYGHFMAFDGILNDDQTNYIILTCLMSLDCQDQILDQAIGMIAQGIERVEIQAIRAIVLTIATRFDVVFRGELVRIPGIPAPSEPPFPPWAEFM